MNEDQIAALNNDPDFLDWLDNQDAQTQECMEEDGFLLAEFDDYEDGHFERQGSNERW